MKRTLTVLHTLIRNQFPNEVRVLFSRHPRWPYLSMPSKKTLVDTGAAARDGSTLERFVDAVMIADLNVPYTHYALGHELDPVAVELESPTQKVPTHYRVSAADVWVEPKERSRLRSRISGCWLRPDEALEHPDVSPTAKHVLRYLVEREQALDAKYRADPAAEKRPDAPQRFLKQVTDGPTMEMLALKWHAANRGGVRHLPWDVLRDILDHGDRAFNLRVADPYLRYHNQGCGFTWSFFTHKDMQDLHVHGEPTVEIYGVLEGELEMWYKPYHDRGEAAWSRRVLGPHDWAEVGPLQCHMVRWLGEGKGVVFKASPGVLTGVGRLGVCGKTVCDCSCQKPEELIQIQASFKR